MYIKQFGQHSSRPRARLPGSEECFNALGIFHALGSGECFNAELCAEGAGAPPQAPWLAKRSGIRSGHWGTAASLPQL